MIRYFFFLLFFLILSVSVSAHLKGGEDIVIDGYLADFGYSEVPPLSGEEVFLSFHLVNDTTKEPIFYDSLWLRISTEEMIAFAGTFSVENSNVNFAYSFPNGGDYTVLAKYFNGDTQIVESEFRISVRGVDSSTQMRELTRLVILLMAFMLAVLIVTFLLFPFIIGKRYKK